MNVIQTPDAMSFCRTMKDFIIDTEDTLSIVLKMNNTTVIEEEYSPDTNYQVRLWGLGDFISKLLYGSWTMGHIPGALFTIAIGSTYTYSFYVVQQHSATKKSADASQWLMASKNQILAAGEPLPVNALLGTGDGITIIYKDTEGEEHTAELISASTEQSIVSVTLDEDTVSELTGENNFESMDSFTLKAGNDILTVYRYFGTFDESSTFRFMNTYDCPEYLYMHGLLSGKPGSSDTIERMEGVDRKFTIDAIDEWTVNSGPIFQQSDYRKFRDFGMTQQAAILMDGDWLPILITKIDYERKMRNGVLDAVKFAFKMAKPSDNGLMDI